MPVDPEEARRLLDSLYAYDSEPDDGLEGALEEEDGAADD
jgi:hypothetical protein